jgi:hypothetical protein
MARSKKVVKLTRYSPSEILDLEDAVYDQVLAEISARTPNRDQVSLGNGAYIKRTRAYSTKTSDDFFGDDE